MKRALYLIGLAFGLQTIFLAESGRTATTPDSPKPSADITTSKVRLGGQPASNDALKLKMISGTAQRRIATINDETFSGGETHKVTLGDKKVLVECLEIREQTALVKVEGEAKPRELKLGEVQSGTFDSALPQELEFTKYNFAITLPYGWHVITGLPKDRSFTAAYSSADATGYLMITVDETGQAPPVVNDRFIAEFEQGIQAGGGEKPISKGRIVVGGITGYERVGNQLVEGQRVPVLSQAVVAGGTGYFLAAFRVKGDAAKDPEIRGCLASFRFLTAPAPPSDQLAAPAPAPSRRLPAAPAPAPSPSRDVSSQNSTAYRFGYSFGGVIMIVLGIAVVRAIVRRIS